MKNENGTSLIEVLVTMLILATSLLAMAALQSRSLQHNHSAYLRSQANIFAYDIVDRVRIANAGEPVVLAVPSDDEIEDVVESLPGGEVDLACNANRYCTVTITWGEQEGTNADGETSTFAYTTQI